MGRWEHSASLFEGGEPRQREPVMEMSRKTRQNETRQDRRKRIFPGTQQAPADSAALL